MALNGTHTIGNTGHTADHNLIDIALGTKMVFRGAWNGATGYVPNEVVSRSYALWISLLTASGNDPLTPGSTTVVASVGATGLQGVDGGVIGHAQGFTLSAPLTFDTFGIYAQNGATYYLGITNAAGLAAHTYYTDANSHLLSVTYTATSTGWVDVPLGFSTTLAAGTWVFVQNATAGSQIQYSNGQAAVGCTAGIFYAGGSGASATNTGSYVDNGSGGSYSLPFKLENSGVQWVQIANLDAAPTVTSKTAAYSMKSTDRVVLASGTFTVTLPPVASAIPGRPYTVKNIGTGTVTVAPASGTVDGAASFVMSVQYSSVDAVTDGTNWFTV